MKTFVTSISIPVYSNLGDATESKVNEIITDIVKSALLKNLPRDYYLTTNSTFGIKSITSNVQH